MKTASKGLPSKKLPVTSKLPVNSKLNKKDAKNVVVEDERTIFLRNRNGIIKKACIQQSIQLQKIKFPDLKDYFFQNLKEDPIILDKPQEAVEIKRDKLRGSDISINVLSNSIWQKGMNINFNNLDIFDKQKEKQKSLIVQQSNASEKILNIRQQKTQIQRFNSIDVNLNQHSQIQESNQIYQMSQNTITSMKKNEPTIDKSLQLKSIDFSSKNQETALFQESNEDASIQKMFILKQQKKKFFIIQPLLLQKNNFQDQSDEQPEFQKKEAQVLEYQNIENTQQQKLKHSSSQKPKKKLKKLSFQSVNLQDYDKMKASPKYHNLLNTDNDIEIIEQSSKNEESKQIVLERISDNGSYQRSIDVIQSQKDLKLQEDLQNEEFETINAENDNFVSSRQVKIEDNQSTRFLKSGDSNRNKYYDLFLKSESTQLKLQQLKLLASLEANKSDQVDNILQKNSIKKTNNSLISFNNKKARTQINQSLEKSEVYQEESVEQTPALSINKRKQPYNNFENQKIQRSVDLLIQTPQTELNKYISRNVVGSPQMFKIQIKQQNQRSSDGFSNKQSKRSKNSRNHSGKQNKMKTINCKIGKNQLLMKKNKQLQFQSISTNENMNSYYQTRYSKIKQDFTVKLNTIQHSKSITATFNSQEKANIEPNDKLADIQKFNNKIIQLKPKKDFDLIKKENDYLTGSRLSELTLPSQQEQILRAKFEKEKQLKMIMEKRSQQQSRFKLNFDKIQNQYQNSSQKKESIYISQNNDGNNNGIYNDIFHYQQGKSKSGINFFKNHIENQNIYQDSSNKDSQSPNIKVNYSSKIFSDAGLKNINKRYFNQNTTEFNQ